MTQVKQQPQSPFISKTCTKCAHIKVCSIFRAIAPLLQSWKDGERPLEAEDLATVCKEFVSNSTLAVLRESLEGE